MDNRPDINIGIFLEKIMLSDFWAQHGLIPCQKIHYLKKKLDAFIGEVKEKHAEKNGGNGFYGTIFVIGISRISSAPNSLSFGMSWLTELFWTTVWIL
jgi:hypothetical protein